MVLAIAHPWASASSYLSSQSLSDSRCNLHATPRRRCPGIIPSRLCAIITHSRSREHSHTVRILRHIESGAKIQP